MLRVGAVAAWFNAITAWLGSALQKPWGGKWRLQWSRELSALGLARGGLWVRQQQVVLSTTSHLWGLCVPVPPAGGWL